MSNLTHHQTCH